MKIALIDPSLFTWPYDIALTNGLVASGHEVTVYGRKPSGRLPDDEARYLRRHFYRSIEGAWAKKLPTKLFLALKGLSHIGSMLRLAISLRRDRPDVIHFQWAPLAVVDKKMLWLFRGIAPLIFTVHDSAPFNDNPKSRIQRLGAIAIMHCFDRLIVHTERARARVESYGVPADRINRIAHGLLDIAPSPGSISVADEDRGERPITLLLFGQIKPYKGTDILLKAIALLPDAVRRRCRIRIVGRPQMPMEPIFALIEELGISDQVELDLRFIDDGEINGLLRSADIQMFPYSEIDASGVLMLALTVGRPIIASDIGLFRELLEDGVHGALVPPGDVQRLSAAIQKLVLDDAYRAEAGRNVRVLCESIPNWDEIGRSTATLYQEAIAQRSASR